MRGRIYLTRTHLVATIIVCVVLPLASWLDGSGQLAWTMFSRTGQFRLVIVADGTQMNPTEIAAAAMPGPTAIALAGSDQLKHHDVMRATARRHLDDIADLACRLRPGAQLTVRLEERVRRSEPIRTSEVTRRCAR
ncbi:MAG TPA: hypothetical protein VFV99_09720 [Kofleriaceae bacterium]|nr:hypothetical protein [Kofleriaceae bacterium]